jgi:hypothetical protein
MKLELLQGEYLNYLFKRHKPTWQRNKSIRLRLNNFFPVT